MNKIELKKRIFDSINAVGVISSKGDITDNDPMDKKVWVKKVNIGKDFGHDATGIEVACVSLTCTSNDFKDASINNVRINTKNRQGQWCNIFINEAPKELLEFVLKEIEK